MAVGGSPPTLQKLETLKSACGQVDSWTCKTRNEEGRGRLLPPTQEPRVLPSGHVLSKCPTWLWVHFTHDCVYVAYVCTCAPPGLAFILLVCVCVVYVQVTVGVWRKEVDSGCFLSH